MSNPLFGDKKPAITKIKEPIPPEPKELPDEPSKPSAPKPKSIDLRAHSRLNLGSFFIISMGGVISWFLIDSGSSWAILLFASVFCLITSVIGIEELIRRNRDMKAPLWDRDFNWKLARLQRILALTLGSIVFLAGIGHAVHSQLPSSKNAANAAARVKFTVIAKDQITLVEKNCPGSEFKTKWQTFTKTKNLANEVRFEQATERIKDEANAAILACVKSRG